jgi:hypothetical protein
MSVAALPLAAALPYGFAVGVAYLLALRLNTRLYLANGPLWRPIVLMPVRLLGSVALLGAVVPWGWGPTLVALGGFALARPVTLRWLDRRQPEAVAGGGPDNGRGGEG